MDFGLSEEQELLQQTLRGFVERECPAPRLRQAFESGEGNDPALWDGLAELGVAGLALPERYGGGGLEVLDLALAAEVLGEGALPVPFLGHALAGLALAWGGSEAQREKWLPRLAAGRALGSVALGEAGGLWQPEEWSAWVEGGRLAGAKQFVPAGGLADVIVVGTAGGGLALVERGAPGVRLEAVEGVDRTRRCEHLHLDAAPCEPLEDGAAVSTRLRDAALVLLAADAFGGAWQLLRMTIGYALTREQFGTPLAQFQAVKHQIANAALEIEPSRGLWWWAAHAVDRLPEQSARAAAAAKAHVTDRALEVAKDAVELHGGLGYTWECDVQIWFKRAMFDRAWLGSPERHRERHAALAGW
jgi:alkylation response protein AidB-like acyl-CoA dehydrogenase